MNSQWFVDCVKQAARWACIAALILAGGAHAVQAGGPPPSAVPELDPGAIASAMMLFTGGLLMLQARRKQPIR
jgi:hypothetical protein